MFLPLLLQASWPVLHPAVLALLGALLSAGLGFVAARYWKRYDAQVSADKAEAEWRKARIDAEARLDERISNLFKQSSDALQTESRDRLKWQLENDTDLGRIAEILKDVNETQKLTATLAANDRHTTSELLRLDKRVESISDQLTKFIMDHARHT